MKRVVLFLATNVAIIVVLGAFLNILFPLLGIELQGIAPLLLFALCLGMGGSFISLALSKSMAKRAMGAQVITQPCNETERWLLATVEKQAKAAGIGMPEVAIFESGDVNAFATGMKRDDALVAVSTGLLRSMTRDEAEAVLGHEVSHVANGDMITLALIQGVVNTFVIFLARVLANIVSSALNDRNGQGLGMFAYIALVSVLELIFGILASIIVMWFSRQREFRADAGGANLAGRQKMIAALERLRQSQPSQMEGQFTAFGINREKLKWSSLFMSHPPLEQRIERLKQASQG